MIRSVVIFIVCVISIVTLWYFFSEAVVALLLQHYGYPMEVAFASAVGLRLVAFVPNAIVTLYVTLVEGFDFMRARQSNELSGNL